MTHAEAIAALGGGDEVAKLLGVHRTRPGRWARGEGIPPRHWAKLTRIARERGVAGITVEGLEAASPFTATEAA